MAALSCHPPPPAYDAKIKLRDFLPTQYTNWNDAFQHSPGGAFGRAVRAVWLPPRGDNREVVVKMLPGRNALFSPPGTGTTLDAFKSETGVLQKCRLMTAWTSDEVALGATPAAHVVGFNHLCFTYGSGFEDDARAVLPDAPAAPLYLIAMEPLKGGSLWQCLHLDPMASVYVGLPLLPEKALLAAVDILAGLSALHWLGHAHADPK
jgi:hypothetical protein